MADYAQIRNGGPDSGPHQVTAPYINKKNSSATRSICIFYSVAMCFIGIHAGFFAVLNNKPVDETIGQGLSTALANILAIFVEVSLLGGLGLAYNRILGNFLGQKPVDGRETKLDTLASSPWNLFRRSIFLRLFRIKRLWLVGFLCAGIPFAAVFPPGALIVKFENSVNTTMSGVATMNISDYGNGTLQDFVKKSLFEMNGDLSYMNQLRPSLNALAAQVLSSGGPVKLDSPCGASCVYDISIEGPRFNCKERGRRNAFMDDCSIIYRADDEIGRSSDELYSRTNNSFKMSWYTSLRPGICKPEGLKTLDCSMTLATYNLHIKNSLDSSQSINVDIENEREIWSDKAWIQTQFYYYFFYGGSINEPRIANDTIKTNFTNAQAFAISRAAVHALQGEVKMSADGPGVIFFQGNASQVLGSPYIGLADRYNARFNISTANIEKYLQDVVVSTISLKMSTHNGDIGALVGAEVYQFSEKAQFFAGYGACLLVAGGIFVFSYLCAN
ncbi:hypothetical protein FOPG_19230 [Fusarium oxysporum f. sp. conglutinans race 2 54008]|uniref:Uncharacterized protein n=1 Tax=Fusarium oxysporum f. sp. conglutinans race 2 54008 TaxID=1089457 RepID=X0GXC8_FUSOX|nr:hypothetical protein FOPG_19230 [Fusarium oxysporum f. sp. conglutinans race 2 54008]